ncbi:SRPBCC family protein [Nocardia sp. NPDC059764]|uniref:SRPBCC family protein n=1 Tax=Nocardia sp. NPDC059764 TaxID=3346939 RepID=UPI00365B1BC5
MRWSSTASRRLPASNDDVWAVVSDLSRHGEWLPCHQQWLDPLPTPLRRGTSATEQVTAFGAVHEIRWTITEWTPPSTLQFSAAARGLLTFSYGAQLQPIGPTSTNITLRAVLAGAVLRQLKTNQLQSATRIELYRAVTTLEALFHPGIPTVTHRHGLDALRRSRRTTDLHPIHRGPATGDQPGTRIEPAPESDGARCELRPSHP